MLKIIEIQYQREIQRRLKQEEKVKLEAEIGEKIIDSPLRRAREYACNIAGSPSPMRRMIRKGTFEFSISPEKGQIELREPQGNKLADKATVSSQKKVFGLTIQKSKISLAKQNGGGKKGATSAINSERNTPEKRVSKIAASHMRNVSKGTTGSKISGAARKAIAL